MVSSSSATRSAPAARAATAPSPWAKTGPDLLTGGTQDDLAVPLQPGQSCTFRRTFTLDTPGPFTRTFTLNYRNSTAPITIRVVRNPSQKFDNKINGTVWLADLAVTQ